MTGCRTTRGWLLEVDPQEIEPMGPKELAQGADARKGPGAQQADTRDRAAHLAECSECRALADEILGAEAVLRAGLDSVRPALDVETALANAREAHQAMEVRRTTLRRRGLRAALPLAAASLAGLIVLGRPAPVRIADLDPATVSAARRLGLVGPGPVVKAASDDRLAVLPTENPNITIIWFME